MNESLEVPIRRLHEAFKGRRCISAWLGYGDPLFLGLGGDELSELGSIGPGDRPPFELQTNFSEWLIEGPIAARSDDSAQARKEAAAESLIGEQVADWELLDRYGLRLTFTGAKMLTIVPWSAGEGLSDAWCLSSPDDHVLAVATDGQVVVVDASLPVCEWFRPVD